MNQPLPLISATPPSLLQEVLGLYRRVCILRHQGKALDAQTLHDAQFMPALRRLEKETPLESAELNVHLAAASRRVEDAALLAELIAPFLPTVAAAAAVPSVIPRKPAPTPAAHASPTPRPQATDGNVASFIDDMLAQRPADRRR